MSTLALERARVEAILSSTMEGISRSTQSLGGDEEMRRRGDEERRKEEGGRRKVEERKRKKIGRSKEVEGTIRNAGTMVREVREMRVLSLAVTRVRLFIRCIFKW